MKKEPSSLPAKGCGEGEESRRDRVLNCINKTAARAPACTRARFLMPALFKKPSLRDMQLKAADMMMAAAE